MYLTTLILCVLSVVTLAPVSSAASQNTPSDSAAVMNVHLQWFRALLEPDTSNVARVLAPAVTLTFAKGNALPRATLLSLMQRGQLRYTAANMESAQLTVYEGAAIIVGRASLTVQAFGTTTIERVLYTATYVRLTGIWRMAAWQSTMQATSGG